MDLVIDGEDSCIKGPSISYTIAKSSRYIRDRKQKAVDVVVYFYQKV